MGKRIPLPYPIPAFSYPVIDINDIGTELRKAIKAQGRNIKDVSFAPLANDKCKVWLRTLGYRRETHIIQTGGYNFTDNIEYICFYRRRRVFRGFGSAEELIHFLINR